MEQNVNNTIPTENTGQTPSPVKPPLIRKGFLLALAFFLLLLGAFVIWNFLNNQKGQEVLPPQEKKTEEKSALEDLLPKDSKNPEDFLEQVNTKAKEIQKEYDSNLTAISKKKWANIFSTINQLPATSEYIPTHITILSSSVEKTPDQSNLFKIKYKIKVGFAEAETEDSFFLILSGEKAKSLGFPEEKGNVFFSEKEITDNLAKEGFGKVGNLGPKEDLIFPSFEESIKALNSYMKGESQENHVVAGNEKISQNGGALGSGLFITGKVTTDSSCNLGFMSLFDNNSKGIVPCQN